MCKSFAYTFAVVLLLILTGCGKASESEQPDKKIIAVSIEPLRNIVERIAGDDYEVVTILDKGANPETFDPSMSKRVAADQSIIYFTVGAFPFEQAIEKSGNGTNKTVDASSGIKRLYGTHGHNADHDCEHGADPHTWSSIKNIRKMAENVANSMAGIDAENADEFEKRLSLLTAELDSLDRNVAESLSEAKTQAFAIWHPSLGYFARDYGLKQIAVGEESKEVSPRKLKEIIASAKEDSVKVFFFQKEYDSRQASAINEQIGSRLITIDLLDYDWISQIELICNELAR